MRKVIINFSGGKDSTVAILEAMKRYPKEEIILCFQDTGAEYIDTPAHVKNIAMQLGLPLVVLKREQDFWDITRKRKFFPTPGVRWCTSYLKRDLVNKWLTANFRGTDVEVIVVTGIRGEESRSRAKHQEWENPRDNHVVSSASKIWYPCLYMSGNEVKERVVAEGLPLNPCYDYSPRCNCWCCIFAPPAQVRLYAELHPDVYEKACILEDEIKNKWRQSIGFNDLMKQGRLIEVKEARSN